MSSPGKSEKKNSNDVKIADSPKQRTKRLQTDHVTYEAVETHIYVSEPEHHDHEEEERLKIVAKTAVIDKHWDELELMHHGLVDPHGHHDLIKPPGGLVKGVVGHVPFDEVEMKHSGFVNDHCHHMTQNELVNDPEDKQSFKMPHVAVEIDSSDRGSTTSPSTKVTTAASSECTKATIIEEDEKSKHLSLSPQVEVEDINAGDASNKEERLERCCKVSKKIPWDELELKGHGLVDSTCHHTQQNENGEPLGKGSRKILYDEIEMKHTGLVDDHCHHMREAEIDKAAKVIKTAPAPHILWSVSSTKSETNTSKSDDSFPPLKYYSGEPKQKSKKSEEKRKSRPGRPKRIKRRSSKAKSIQLKINFTGTVNVTSRSKRTNTD